MGDDDRHLALTVADAQHLLHPLRVEFDIKVDMLRVRLTGAVGVGSALFTVDDDVHALSLVVVGYLGKRWWQR